MSRSASGGAAAPSADFPPRGGMGGERMPAGGRAPLSPHDQAARLAVLAGGAEELYLRARGALDAGDPGWAAILAGHLLTLDPGRLDYRLLRSDALKSLAGVAPTGFSPGVFPEAARK